MQTMAKSLSINDKFCKKCNCFKTDDELYAIKSKRDGTRYQCRKCHLERSNKWNSANRESLLNYKTMNKDLISYKNRVYLLNKKFNLTLEEYETLLGQQGGVCAICKESETAIDSVTGKVRNLAVDHCHKTGKIRGLLCRKHNQALGVFKDDLELLKEAIKYLERNTHEECVN